MKSTKLLSLLILPLLFGLNSFPSQAETLSLPLELAQSEGEKNTELLQKKATELLNLFFNKEFEEVRKMISPQLKEQVSLEFLEQEWLQTNSYSGDFKKIINSKVIQTPNSDLVIATVEFEKAKDDWIVIFNKNQEIMGTDFPTTETIENIAVELVNSLAMGNFDKARAYLHPFLKEDIFPEQVESKWEQLQKENGNFQTIIDTNTRRGSTLDNMDMVLVNIEFTNNIERMLILFDSNKRIIGVDFPTN